MTEVTTVPDMAISRFSRPLRIWAESSDFAMSQMMLSWTSNYIVKPKRIPARVESAFSGLR